MLALVTADNLLQMFFGWEGVGLASYLLIGFWYQKPSANTAAIKAFVVNRVGDFGFVLGIFLSSSCSVRSASTESSPPRPDSPHTTIHVLGKLARDNDRPACCCSWARWASRRSSSSTPGCPTRWKARRRSRP